MKCNVLSYTYNLSKKREIEFIELSFSVILTEDSMRTPLYYSEETNPYMKNVQVVYGCINK